jgi:YbbR domain-containing protein
VLYTGLVFSGQFTDRTIDVPVDDINQPDSSQVLSGDLGTVQVRYRTANDIAGTVGAQAFVATVDLSTYDMDDAPEPQVLEIQIATLIEGIEILAVEPPTARVAIDRIETRTVEVEVDAGEIPEGLEIGDPVLSQEEVQVRGAASVVRQVDRVLARIRIDGSGIDFNDAVSLVPVDVAGQEVRAGVLGLEPESVSVQVDVRFIETTQSLPIRPDITGTPAPGFALEALSVEPAAVTVNGLPEVLAALSEVLTENVSIDGLSADESFEVELVLPDDVELAGDATITVGVSICPSVSSRTFVVGVVCANAGDNACLPALEQLSLTLSGPGGALSGLSASTLTPSLDASGLEPGTYQLTPTLPQLPAGVEIQGISPGTVTVTIVAPATPAPTATPAP